MSEEQDHLEETPHRPARVEHFENDGDIVMLVFFVLVPLAILYYVLKKHNLI